MAQHENSNKVLTAEDFEHADRDLATQGKPGSLLYTAIWVLVIGVTPLRDDLPLVAWGGLVLLTVPGIVRLLLGIRFNAWYPRDPLLWQRAYAASVMSLALVWGGLIALLIWHYHAAWPAMISSFATAGIAAGGTISLSTNRRLQRAYIVTMLVPAVLAGLATLDRDAAVIGLLFAANTLFLLTIGVRLDHGYWQNMRNLRLLTQRAQQLDEARARAESADRAKGQFVAKVSHELRTPLNGLVGTIDVMAGGDASTQQRRYLDIMAKSADLLLQRINEILDFSKMEAGRLAIESLPMRAGAVVRDCVSMMRDSAQAKGLTLQTALPAPEQGSLLGDPNRLTQVLLNLLSNAIKFTHDGTIVVELRQQRHGDRVRCTFAVSDPGIGIPVDVQGHIFDSFTQADDSTTREYGGTGLGLAVSRDLVRLMGGELIVDSEPGRGSRFSFDVELALCDEATEHATDAHDDAPAAGRTRVGDDGAPATTLHVLVAEDNPVNQFIAQEMLTALGHSSEVVDDGMACVARFERGGIDAILMDCDMPGIDGCEAAERIRGIETQGQRPPVPIIALTAHAGQAERARAISAGMQTLVTKPFVVDDLASALQRSTHTADA